MRHGWGEGGNRSVTLLWKGDLKKGDHLEDLCLDWMVILKWIYKESDGFAWT
jgi:hypothetical protein